MLKKTHKEYGKGKRNEDTTDGRRAEKGGTSKSRPGKCNVKSHNP